MVCDPEVAPADLCHTVGYKAGIIIIIDGYPCFNTA